MPTFHKCSKCKIEKKHEGFHKDRRRKNGLNSWCKQCVSKQRREKYYDNLEKSREYQRNWKKELKEKNVEHYKELTSTSNRNYRNNHPKKVKHYKKKWANSKKGKFSIYKKSALERSLSFELAFDDFLLYWQKPCFYCGSKIKTIGLDRIDNFIGYRLDNIVSCCSICNKFKGSMLQKDFVELISKIYNNLELKNG